MRILFWLSLVVIAYAYAGYPLLLLVLARLQPRPIKTGQAHPPVSVILPAHNEVANLRRKLPALQAVDYPRDRLEIVVVSDGSTDGTDVLLEDWPGIVSVRLATPAGKAVALNHGVAAATGEILVFVDARQEVESAALRRLVACFADPTVGAVSGELHLVDADGQPSPDSLGVYWRIEKMVRRLESATGSVVGVTGALFAMRRALYKPLPAGTLLDDVLTPMRVARCGYRVLFLETAIARDRIFSERGKEFRRKVRTLTGNFQLLQLAPWLLAPRNPLLFRFVSHKLLRLLVPWLLLVLLLSSALAQGTFYQLAFVVQVFLYGLALLGAAWPLQRRFRPVSVAYTFVLLNAAAAVAFYNFLAGRARWA